MGHAGSSRMHLVPNRIDEERVLSSVIQEGSTPDRNDAESPFVLKGAGVLSGSARWIFIGILVGALVLSVLGFIFGREGAREREQIAFHKLMGVATHSLAASPDSVATPAPVIVQLSADMVRVTAIALGHPRLAVINNKPVAEGDTIVVHAPTRSVALTLRIVKISDGWIDMSDGTQVFTARLTVLPPTQAASH